MRFFALTSRKKPSKTTQKLAIFDIAKSYSDRPAA